MIDISQCMPEIILFASSIACFIVLFVISLCVTRKRALSELPRVATVEDFKKRGAALIRNAQDFERFLCLNGPENERMTTPFRLTRYGPSKLYSHHMLVTGWVRTTNGDYILTTIEYGPGASGYRRSLSRCCRTICHVFCRCECCSRFWGHVKIGILLLSMETSESNPNLVLLLHDCSERNQSAPCDDEIQTMEAARDIIWEQNRITELLGRLPYFQLDIENNAGAADGHVAMENGANSLLTINFDDFIAALERNPRDEARLKTVATRAKGVIGEDIWAIVNNCEHLVNYLLTGIHKSDQCLEAHFAKRILMYIVTPFFEKSVMFKFLNVLPHVAAVLLASFEYKEHLRYVVVISMIYCLQFLPAAWLIANMVGLEAQQRSSRCTVTIIQVIIRATMTAAAISMGCLFGHWEFTCSPYWWDELFVSTSFFICSYFIFFPILAATFDSIVFHAKSRRYIMFVRLTTMLLVILQPLILLAPYYFVVFYPN